MTTPDSSQRDFSAEATTSIRSMLKRLNLTADERSGLGMVLAELEDTLDKLEHGHVEICVFGEVSSGKSSLLNALLGEVRFEVGAEHGVTRERQRANWQTAAFDLAGAGTSELMLIDTPGINEIDGQQRAELAARVVRRADLVLFVIDGDLNDVEFQALRELHQLGKPIVLVINKADLYSPEQLTRIATAVNARIGDFIPTESVVFAAADPLPRERVYVQADGTEQTRHEPVPGDVRAVELRILDILHREGKAVTALSASLFANVASDEVRDRIIAIRADVAQRVVAKFALFKAISIALNPIPMVDVLGAATTDAWMIKAIGDVYGLQPTMANSQSLIAEIVKSMGVLGVMELATHTLAGIFETATLGLANVVTAVPQGAVAGWSSFVIGRAAAHYYRHGGSWGDTDPKAVLKDIMNAADARSVINELKSQLREAVRRTR